MKQLEGLNENDLIFYDIESARSVKTLEEGTPLYEAWKYKCRYGNELNKKTGQEFTVEEYFYEKSPLYAVFGRVVSVIIGRIKDNKIYLKSYTSYDEKELLENLNRDLNTVFAKNPKSRFVSFNGVGFDTPYLEKRSIINGVKPATLISEGHLEPWKVTQIDLAKIWKGNAFYPDSLLAVATALGLPSPKDALDGSMVSQAFYDGRLDEIEKYCFKDVETTARIYRKLAFKEDLDEGVVIINKKEKEVPAPIMQRLYMCTDFTKELAEEFRQLFKEKNLLEEDKAGVEEILIAHYIDKIDVMDMDKKEKKEVNEERIQEIKDFMSTL